MASNVSSGSVSRMSRRCSAATREGSSSPTSPAAASSLRRMRSSSRNPCSRSATSTRLSRSLGRRCVMPRSTSETCAGTSSGIRGARSRRA